MLIASFAAHAASKWDIGFNEPFVAGYMQQVGQCEQCPTNSYPANPSMVASRLLDLVGTQHVGVYREIIPLRALRPTSTTNRYETAIDILSIYSNYNANLVITFGLPIPDWMSQTGSRDQIMPVDDASWTVLKNSLSQETGDFVRALWNSPRINRTWLQERVYFEGFNEFDSLLTVQNTRDHASPQRAADLQNGIQTVLNSYGLPVHTLMPSVVGVYAGYSTQPPNLIAKYMSDYYAAGGTGLPNAHIYVNANASQGASFMLAGLRAQVVAISNALPASMKGQLYIGETGAADRLAPYCTADSQASTLDIAERDGYYASVAMDPTIASRTHTILFWRLMNLPIAQLPQCDALYGVVHDDNSGYKGVGTNLFNYLKQP